MTARAHLQRGLTLVELMVVIAIVGVLMGAAVVMVSTDPTTRDVANKTTTLLRECSRQAVGGGSLRADVATALGTTARSRLVIDGSGTSQLVTVEILVEEDAPATGAVWEVRQSHFISPPLEIFATRSSAELLPGLGPETTIGNGTAEIRCYPNGACDASTLYIHNTKKDHGKVRVVVMPLNGAPMIFGDW